MIQRVTRRMENKLFLDFNDQQLLILLEDVNGDCQEKRISYDMKRPFSLEEMKEQIRKAMSESSLKGISWYGTDFTLIPESIFLETELQTYYELNFGKLANDQVLQFEKLHSFQAVLIYTVPKWLKEMATSTLFLAHVPSLVSLCLKKQFSGNEANNVYLLIQESSFLLSVKQNKQLQLCLPSEFHGTTDILYFILANQQKMNLPTVNALHVYPAGSSFDQETFESLWKQFKDFSEFETHFYSQAAYQKSILCASSEVS